MTSVPSECFYELKLIFFPQPLASEPGNGIWGLQQNSEIVILKPSTGFSHLFLDLSKVKTRFSSSA
jgi:hypothetical protein